MRSQEYFINGSSLLAAEDQANEDSSSSSDPFSSGKESWLGAEESSSESSSDLSHQEESKHAFEEIKSDLKDKKKVQWSMLEDARPMRQLKRVESRFLFSNRQE